MNTIILHIDKYLKWMPETWFIAEGGTKNNFDQFFIERNNDYLSVLREDSVLDEYEEVEIQIIHTYLKDSKVYLIEWRGEKLLQEFLKSIPNNSCIIDNDHGLIVPVEKVKSIPLKNWIYSSKID